MRQIQYKKFSFLSHNKNWRKNLPNCCQFELTLRCPLHCRHCYLGCRNNPRLTRKELTFKEVCYLLDKIYDSGVFWLCFSGGDPLIRKDFLDIYAYAKKKGFIITLFTSGLLITEKIADYFKITAPFCVELTLNGVTKKTYEKISGVSGSFEKAIAAVYRLKERNIPFKIKTQVTKQNIGELDKIKEFVENLEVKFRPNYLLFAGISRSSNPCKERLDTEEILNIKDRGPMRKNRGHPSGKNAKWGSFLFQCSAGSDTFHIDAYGNMFLCNTVRSPCVNLLKNEINDGFKLFRRIKREKFKTDSKCKDCSIRHLCYWCPGRAFLETNNRESPIDYFCRLAHLIAGKVNHNE